MSAQIEESNRIDVSLPSNDSDDSNDSDENSRSKRRRVAAVPCLHFKTGWHGLRDE